jgi:hypothetical protein
MKKSKYISVIIIPLLPLVRKRVAAETMKKITSFFIVIIGLTIFIFAQVSDSYTVLRNRNNFSKLIHILERI